MIILSKLNVFKKITVYSIEEKPQWVTQTKKYAWPKLLLYFITLIWSEFFLLTW